MIQRFKDWVTGRKPSPSLPPFLEVEMGCLAQETMAGNPAAGLDAMRLGVRVLEDISKEKPEVAERARSFILTVLQEGKAQELREVKN